MKKINSGMGIMILGIIFVILPYILNADLFAIYSFPIGVMIILIGLVSLISSKTNKLSSEKMENPLRSKFSNIFLIALAVLGLYIY